MSISDKHCGSSCNRCCSGGGNSLAFRPHNSCLTRKLLFAPVVAWFLCAPKYSHGAMSLRDCAQCTSAFVVVQGAFNWLVDNYQRLADWRSSAYRVGTLLLALDELEAKERSERLSSQRNGLDPTRYPPGAGPFKSAAGGKLGCRG